MEEPTNQADQDSTKWVNVRYFGNVSFSSKVEPQKSKKLGSVSTQVNRIHYCATVLEESVSELKLASNVQSEVEEGRQEAREGEDIATNQEWNSTLITDVKGIGNQEDVEVLENESKRDYSWTKSLHCLNYHHHNHLLDTLNWWVFQEITKYDTS